LTYSAVLGLKSIPHVIEVLRKENLGDDVDLMEVLSGLDILDVIKGYDRVIIIDAIQTGGDPGQSITFPQKILSISRSFILSQLI
jgi:Ni,Fe-hydrogenase maturation factor